MYFDLSLFSDSLCMAVEVLLRVGAPRGYGDDWDGNGYLVTNADLSSLPEFPGVSRNRT